MLDDISNIVTHVNPLLFKSDWTGVAPDSDIQSFLSTNGFFVCLTVRPTILARLSWPTTCQHIEASIGTCGMGQDCPDFGLSVAVL